jgi:tetratricopeptide (TPR) repeat protein
MHRCCLTARRYSLAVVDSTRFTSPTLTPFTCAHSMQLRQKRLKAARTILGMAIGKAPKSKLFKFYIDLETQLAQVERVRTLYGKFVEWDSTHVAAWIMFADLEASLQEEERARAIYELALSQQVLNQPERLWMQFIDFEISLGQRDNARALYERLLERTQHVKVRFIQWHFFACTGLACVWRVGFVRCQQSRCGAPCSALRSATQAFRCLFPATCNTQQ